MRTLRASTAPLVAAVAVLGALLAALVAARAAGRTVGGPPANEIAIAVAVTVYAAVAVLICLALPGHRVGRLMLLGVTAWGAGEGVLALGLQGYLHDPSSVPAAELLAVLGTVLRGVGWLVLVIAVPLVFPDGRLPWPGRRAPAVLTGVAITLFSAGSLLSPVPLDYRLTTMDNPVGLPTSLTLLADLLALSGLALCLVALVVAVVGLVHRWRVGDHLLRQQLLWLLVAFAVPLVFIPFISSDLVAPWMFAVVTLPVPLAIAVAMFQRRLYDVQLALTRTLTYLTLSAVVAGVYALTVVGGGALLRERGELWLSWVAAGLVAVSFVPLRNLMQQAVNRMTYGQWAQPADVLAATGRRLADAADVPGLMQSLVEELATGLRLGHVEVRDAGDRLLASHGDDSTGLLDRLPLTAYGAPVGTLVWSKRPLRDTDQRLLEDLGRQLGAVVHGAALLETVREAQHRLVLAREEERRRLRRDLHDGLGPALASLTLQIDTLRNSIGREAVDPDTELLRLRSAVQATVVDVRRLVEGLRPPAIDELGLTGAVEQLADGLAAHGLQVAVDVPPLPPMPAAVEVAVFRIVQEALTNVAHHSAGSRVAVRVRLDDHGVELEVSDDGSGCAAPRSGGIGLGSMRERAEGLSGSLVVDSVPGRGTTIRARLPMQHDASARAQAVRP